jgi:hypothetical protein
MSGLERLPCFEQDDSLVRVDGRASGVKGAGSQLSALLRREKEGNRWEQD